MAFYPQQNMMQPQFMSMGNSYNLGMQNIGQGQNAGEPQQNQSSQSSMQAKSIATMQLAFGAVEKPADGPAFVGNYVLQLSQFDESASTLARINEVKHLLANPQNVEQAKAKLAQLRDENKIWFVIQAKPAE